MSKSTVNNLLKGPRPEQTSDWLHVMLDEERNELLDAGRTGEAAKVSEFIAQIEAIPADLIHALDYAEQDEDLMHKAIELIHDSNSPVGKAMDYPTLADYLQALVRELRRHRDVI